MIKTDARVIYRELDDQVEALCPKCGHVLEVFESRRAMYCGAGQLLQALEQHKCQT